MPTIIATLNGVQGFGVNAVQRPQGTNVRTDINNASPAFAQYLDGLDHENGRSALACAEAQAFGQLVSQLVPPINYNQIVFNAPSEEGGLILWQLCRNCSQWLTHHSGWGSTAKYRLSEAALNILQPKIPKAVFIVKKDDFPSLGGGSGNSSGGGNKPTLGGGMGAWGKSLVK